MLMLEVLDLDHAGLCLMLLGQIEPKRKETNRKGILLLIGEGGVEESG